MGEVYLAREHASERLVAMKFLRYPGCRDDFERFLIELRVLAKLDHPNIVRVLASDFRRADPYFTMEYLPGGSLSRTTGGNVPLLAAEAVRIVRAVALACAAAHAEQVVHRDLKPSNILLAADGTPKVADFGLAKRLDAADSLTHSGGALGTPEYMPPEQISRRNGEIGPRSDVYGLGATLYHLLTGRAPFVGHSSPEVVSKVLADPPARLRALRSDIPVELEGIVLKCLEKDPAHRYSSMTELVADLDRFTTPGQVPLAPQLTRRRRLGQWAVRNRHGLTAILVVAAMLGATFALGRGTYPERTHEPPRVAGPAVPPPPQVAGTPAVLWAPPEITQEQAIRDLRAGNAVVLVGPNGPRVPVTWGLGTCEFPVPPDVKDTRFSLQTVEPSVLELMPDPGIDRYRIRAVVRYELPARPFAGQPVTVDSEVGVSIGHRRVSGKQSKVAHALVAVGFCEPGDNALKARRCVKCTDYAFVGFPLQPLRRAHHPGGSIPLAPGDGSSWRTLEIDVEPTRLTIRHGDTVHTRDAADFCAHRERLETLVNTFHAPGDPVSLGPWSPRLPIGLWVQNSWASVLRVSIESLP